MRRARTTLLHAGQIALLLGCCGLSALVMTRFVTVGLELVYSSWGGPRMPAIRGDLLRDVRVRTSRAY